MNFQIPYSIPLSTYRPFAINGMLPYLGGSALVIQQARDAMNIHPEQQVGSTYLVSETPTLAGVVADETPTRKDRTRLSCRASDFSTNQYFNGPVDIAGWTEFSIGCWIRHGSVAANSYMMGSFGSTSTNFGFFFGVLSVDDTPTLRFYDNSGQSDADIKFPANSTNDNEWHLVTATYDFATETMTGYIDGRDVTASSTVTAGTNGSINTSQDPDDFTIGTLIASPTSYEWNGQLQLPLIYEGVWTPAEVRDLYLGKYDAITAPTYGWFLDSDTAHPLTSASPALVPANSPDLYEDDAVGGGDWYNEKGWNVGNQARLIHTPAGGDTLIFKYKSTTDRVIFVNNLAFSRFGPQSDGGSTNTAVLRQTENLIIDGVAFTGVNRDDLHNAINTGAEVTVQFDLTSDWDGEPIIEIGTYTGYTLDNGYMRLVSINGETPVYDFDNTTVLAPKRWDEELDSDGAPATDSTSFGVARRDGQLRGGPCFSFGGTEYATNGNLVGTETVVSSEGTSTPTISAGRIDFTAGTCWNLLLSNGSHYAGSEEAGIIWHDDVNDEHLTFFNTPSWSTQDTYFWSEANGFSLYEHASSADILVPLKSDGTALSITPPSGYTKTADYPAGAYHNNSQALLEEFPVTDSGSQRAVGYGASFNGTTSVINLGDIGNTTEIQFDLYVPNVTGTKALFQLASGDYVQLNAATLEANDIAGATFYVDGTAGTTIAAATWQTVRVTYTTYDSTAVLIGNQSTSWLTGYVKNLVFKNGSSKVVDAPLYKDSLDRSPNCNHGTDTAITYLTEARATNLNPTISETNTRAVTTGDRKLIRIGQQ